LVLSGFLNSKRKIECGEAKRVFVDLFWGGIGEVKKRAKKPAYSLDLIFP